MHFSVRRAIVALAMGCFTHTVSNKSNMRADVTKSIRRTIEKTLFISSIYDNRKAGRFVCETSFPMNAGVRRSSELRQRKKEKTEHSFSHKSRFVIEVGFSCSMFDMHVIQQPSATSRHRTVFLEWPVPIENEEKHEYLEETL